MALAVGTQLGSHEITALLGKGGMGEVYRARDSKLKREVAIKVLPDEFSRDSERVNRMQREAEVLASLNHPNIAAIYDLQEANGTLFLVLELVEGETLAERIQRGPIPIEEALSIAASLCEALEGAHEKGIVHRDLKPANVKITPDGKVKVLDFGLAKAVAGSTANTALSNSPTMLNSFGGTNAGMIVGTAAYMSPEQARGFAADRRSDLFAFGCVLYEMLTGRQAFQGSTVSDILASVLAREPEYTLISSDANPRLVDLLRRCLQKNPKLRWHCAADLRADLESIATHPRLSPLVTPQDARPRSLWRRAMPAAIAALLVGVITGIAVWKLRPAPALAVTRFSIQVPGAPLPEDNTLALSPDGTELVFAANKRLYLRLMAESTPKPIAGSDSQGILIANPVFSPDGSTIAFIDVLGPTESTIKKLPVTGGTAITLTDLHWELGMRWDHDRIVFSHAAGGLSQIGSVPSGGGKPEILIDMKDELAYNPEVLPDGQTVLFTLGKISSDWKDQIVVQSLKTGKRKTLLQGETARYISPGRLVFDRDGILFAAPFDLQRLELVGEPVPIIEGVSDADGGAFSISNNGSLAYTPGPLTQSSRRSIALIERSGEFKTLGLSAGAYVYPRVSPDGKRIAFCTEEGKAAFIWIYDLSGTSSMRKLTFVGANRYPVWSADSQRVLFQSDREGDLGIFWQRADGTGNAERLTKPENGIAHIPDSASSDGRHFSYTAIKGDERAVWIFSIPDKKATLFASAPDSRLGSSAFSPDGKWLAYHSDETKRYQIFVQPFPADGTKYLVSRDAQSHNPLWSPDGKEMFYIPGPNQFVKLSIGTKPAFTFGDPVETPKGGFIEYGPPSPRTYDITPDGKRFVGVVIANQLQNGIPVTPPIQIILNWFSELQQRVPLK